MIGIREIVVQTVRNILAHKLRSFLTMFGIAWGIASVVLMIAIGDGFKVGYREQLKTLGTDIIIIWGGRTTEQVGDQRAGRPVRLTYEDVLAIRQESAISLMLVPLTTLSDLVDTRYLSNIVIVPVNGVPRKRLIGEIRAALARIHNFNPRDERAVRIIDWNEFGAIITNLGLGLKIILAVIGTLTLSIGAVGVMNIMLVSVTERTREIGVLKSLGARRRHILMQFLLEGLALTLAGGAVGFVVAAALAGAIGQLPLLGPIFKDTSGVGDIRLGISYSALVVSSAVLVSVGVIAGMVPAIRASRLDPVEALRSE